MGGLLGEFGRFALTGNKTAMYKISECQKIHLGICAKPVASILRKPVPNLQQPLVPAKRIAIVLHWLAQASGFWGAEEAPILFSVLGYRMASCS